MRHILLYQDEDGAWIVECPSLPGCYSQGETREEAITNIKEAIQVWIEDAVDHGEEIPINYPLEVEQVTVQLA
jgi:predicted RNase H-like HicB family nuclease